jgi:uncharacterized repeat protein (TIGR01451 family)
MRVRGCLPLIIGLILSLIALAPPCLGAASISMNDSGQTVVDFGAMLPGEDVVVPWAVNLSVLSEEGGWDLTAEPTAAFQNSDEPPRTFAIDFLHYSLDRGRTWTPFSAAGNTILSAQPATGPNGTPVVLDYRLKVPYSAYASDSPYRADVTYTVSSGALSNAAAVPNPFSPDDGGTTFYYNVPIIQDVLWPIDTFGITIRIYVPTQTGWNQVKVIDCGQQTAGVRSCAWDGKDDNGLVLSPSEYRFEIWGKANTMSGLYEKCFAAGLVQIIADEADFHTGQIRGVVADAATEQPLVGATVELYGQTGHLHTVQTESDGSYAFIALAPGLYYLKARMDHYYESTSPLLSVAKDHVTTYDFALTHNTSLFVSLAVTPKRATIGDLISYTATVENIGTGPVQAVTAALQLPAGFTVMKQTADIAQSGRVVHWTIGELAVGAKAQAKLDVRLGPEVKTGAHDAALTARGKLPDRDVAAGPAFATITVTATPFSRDRGAIVGRVFLDADADGVQSPGESGLGGVDLLLENGSLIMVDGAGFFSVQELPAGLHLLTLRNRYLPAGWAPRQSTVIVRVPPGETVVVDFPLEPVAPQAEEVLPEDDGENPGVQVNDWAVLGTLEQDTEGHVQTRLAGRSDLTFPDGHLHLHVDTAQDDSVNGNNNADPPWYPTLGDDSVYAPLKIPGWQLSARYGPFRLDRGWRSLPSTVAVSDAGGPLRLKSGYERTVLGWEGGFQQSNLQIRQVVGRPRGQYAVEHFIGAGEVGPFHLANVPVIVNSETIKLQTFMAGPISSSLNAPCNRMRITPSTTSRGRSCSGSRCRRSWVSVRMRCWWCAMSMIRGRQPLPSAAR